MERPAAVQMIAVMETSAVPRPTPCNAAVARRLREAAALLELQQASPFRVNAYRRAAESIETLQVDLADLEAQDPRALQSVPGIGQGIAAAIREMLATGDWNQLQRLRGSADPVALFTLVPGIGPVLARRIHDELGIETLEALENCVYDGTLQAVAGIGPRRLQGLRVGLAAALDRTRLRQRTPSSRHPSVAEILAIDAEYRTKAAAGSLRHITPKRFNPEHEAWLPILHTQQGAWHFTALYSNTGRAHELGRSRDWVVIYYYDGDHVEGQSTVVTETHGVLKGRRVVRGREAECTEHYAAPSDRAHSARHLDFGLSKRDY
jgi:DNA uptake protein ComE-like DNA-binding protein